MIVSRVRKHIPEVADNTTAPADKQFAAYFKPVNVITKQEHLRRFMEMDPESLMKEMMSPQGSGLILGLLEKHIVRFENLFIEDEQGAKVLATVTDLWELGEFALIMDLFNHLLSSAQLPEKTEKNSASPSGGTPTVGVH